MCLCLCLHVHACSYVCRCMHVHVCRDQRASVGVIPTYLYVVSWDRVFHYPGIHQVVQADRLVAIEIYLSLPPQVCSDQVPLYTAFGLCVSYRDWTGVLMIISKHLPTTSITSITPKQFYLKCKIIDSLWLRQSCYAGQNQAFYTECSLG